MHVKALFLLSLYPQLLQRILMSALLAEPLRTHGVVPPELIQSLRLLGEFYPSSPSDGEYLDALLALSL
jgi:hypothetical protein